MLEPSPLIADLLSRRVVILTGKGGVGKSTTAAVLALIGAQMGKRVLVVEVDAKGNVPDFFDSPRVGFRFRKLHKNIYGLSMDLKASMQEYLASMLKVPKFSLRPLESFLEYTSGAIPGLKEVLVTGKIYFEEKARSGDGSYRWDLIVVDGAPTGHVVSQLAAARNLVRLMRAGPIREQAGRVADMLSDPHRTGLVLVTIPEEMPVNETVDLAKRFADDTDIRPQALILNQFQPEMVPRDRVDDFTAVVGPGAKRFLAKHPEGEPLLQAGEMYLEARDRAIHLGDLVRRSLKLPSVTVPYIFERRHGLAFTRAMAKIMSVAE
ncbi:MAG: ArsA family ATPase [Candidatus Dormiibacterota bacterium]